MLRIKVLAFTVALAWMSLPALAETPSPAPIDAEQKAALAALRLDPKPPKLIRDVHYVTSNEAHIGLFRKVAAERGGIQVGVGAEQNYLLAGWSRPDVLICMDFDEYIADVHRIYGLLFVRAANADDLIAWWDGKPADGFQALLDELVDDPAERKRFARIHKRQGTGIARHLRRMRDRFKKQQLDTWLTDQEQFDFVRQLWAAGRVIPVRGDLTGPNTMQDIGAFAQRFKLPVRLFYLSNAEYYFEYWDGNFRNNVAALPFDDRSVVLHTHPTKKDYTYYHHTGENFAAWATHEKVKWFRSVKRHADKTDQDLFFEITKNPTDVIKPKKVKKKP